MKEEITNKNRRVNRRIFDYSFRPSFSATIAFCRACPKSAFAKRSSRAKAIPKRFLRILVSIRERLLHQRATSASKEIPRMANEDQSVRMDEMLAILGRYDSYV